MTRILLAVLVAAMLMTGALPTPMTAAAEAEAQRGGGTR